MAKTTESREHQIQVICTECVRTGIIPDPRKEPFNLNPKLVVETLCSVHRLCSPKTVDKVTTENM